MTDTLPYIFEGITTLNKLQLGLQQLFANAVAQGDKFKSQASRGIFTQRAYAQYLDNTARLQAALKDVADAIDNLCLIRSDASSLQNSLPNRR